MGKKSGDVYITSRCLEEVMLTEKLAPQSASKLSRYLIGLKGTPNQKLMAAAAGLSSDLPEIKDSAFVMAHKMIAEEEAEGPCCWEILCPRPHADMYLLAHLGIIWAGLQAVPGSVIWLLGQRAQVILGQWLRLLDLVVTPDGYPTNGLPGMRAPDGANLSRWTEGSVHTECRMRQPGGENLAHRGMGGRKQVLKWKATSDRLTDGPWYWMRKILDSGHGNKMISHNGPLSRITDLPKRLRLSLFVRRYSWGTLSWLANPGESKKKEFFVTGSASAHRGDGVERPTDWIQVKWVSPGKHETAAGLGWETAKPLIQGDSKLITIPGVVA